MSVIEVGSVVSLKSGGVNMTVSSINDGYAECHWQLDGKPVFYSYSLLVLKLHEPLQLRR